MRRSWAEVYASMEIDEANPFEVSCAEQVKRMYDRGSGLGDEVHAAYEQLLSTQTPEALDGLRTALDRLILCERCGNSLFGSSVRFCTTDCADCHRESGSCRCLLICGQGE